MKERLQEIDRRLCELLGVNPDDPESLQKVERRAQEVGKLTSRRTRLRGHLNVQDTGELRSALDEAENGTS